MLDIQAMGDTKIQDKAWWAFGVYYAQVDKINKMFTQLQTYEWDYYLKKFIYKCNSYLELSKYYHK